MKWILAAHACTCADVRSSVRRNRLITSEFSTSFRPNKRASVGRAMGRQWRQVILFVASNGMQVSNIDAASKFPSSIPDCRLLPFQLPGTYDGECGAGDMGKQCRPMS